MKSLSLLKAAVHPHHLSGPIIEAPLTDVAIGEICEIRRHWRDAEISARAQVVGFRRDMAVLSLLGNPKGLSRESVLMPTGGAQTVLLDGSVLGAVLDSDGNHVDRMGIQQNSFYPPQVCALDAAPPSFQQRVPITEVFSSGIRVIDALTTCGIGQRMGIFSPAGTGKTTLVNMLMERSSADVYVVGLIGERGREVTEFVDAMKRSEQRSRTVVVYATSDASSIDRCNAALLATTVAEYFRDQGQRVVLIQDSLTRYTRALRDVALAAGEAPVRRGYPASVFEALPRLLERPGATHIGSITAFYTVLLESDEETDPMAEEIRSILDGHIYLSRKLALRNQYPAIDVLKSLSRVVGHVCSREHINAAAAIRQKFSRLDELQLMLDLGEYRPGENPENDYLLQKKDDLAAWLKQDIDGEFIADTLLDELREHAA
ncbi:type III secretion protein N (ATPase) [Herbaspirillum sp. Sphag1AN]|uniref:type III secretion system ATPase SctN n=1 Tax=unclassified Herbaspirillum TaxID=2624150 RepID=UPI001613AF9F|nr:MULTISPECIES: type III secretion system ATPase SctN [unclassified Herbaspirillum]MBB3211525.1 type III secretion protein N (ATPase) [Herbaspirillum sp. Sphag1AN]MBB3245209.1 type III secretion protein N (ATPase) [Herbaspirillum sp. Sphag64]